VEQWILHKLNIAADEINKHMADRNFMMVTTSVHNFWLYELCDVFIVGSVVIRAVLVTYFTPNIGSNETHDR
jgi:valyl-tRNA synthetase